MIWVWVVVAVLVVGVAAVLVAGRDDEMADVYDDRPDVSLPAGRPMSAADLDGLRFSTGLRGYRMDEVDAFIARVKADLISRETHELRPERAGDAEAAETSQEPAAEGRVEAGAGSSEQSENLEPDAASSEAPDEPDEPEPTPASPDQPEHERSERA
ncbi:MAG: DivIVA domain-containing protein [Nocardioidaceae bacterium]